MAGLLLCLIGFWIPIKAQLAQILLKQAWEKSLQTGKPHKAWYWADTWPVARLTIPSLKLDAIILKEAGGEALAFGPVHLAQSAPFGKNGKAIIAGHRDTSFKALAKLAPDTLIHLQTLKGEKHSYKLSNRRIARWDKSGLSADFHAEQLILTSCWPFDSMQPGPLRFIAEASRLTAQQAKINATAPTIKATVAADID